MPLPRDGRPTILTPGASSGSPPSRGLTWTSPPCSSARCGYFANRRQLGRCLGLPAARSTAGGQTRASPRRAGPRRAPPPSHFRQGRRTGSPVVQPRRTLFGSPWRASPSGAKSRVVHPRPTPLACIPLLGAGVCVQTVVPAISSFLPGTIGSPSPVHAARPHASGAGSVEETVVTIMAERNRDGIGSPRCRPRGRAPHRAGEVVAIHHAEVVGEPFLWSRSRELPHKLGRQRLRSSDFKASYSAALSALCAESLGSSPRRSPKSFLHWPQVSGRLLAALLAISETRRERQQNMVTARRRTAPNFMMLSRSVPSCRAPGHMRLVRRLTCCPSSDPATDFGARGSSAAETRDATRSRIVAVGAPQQHAPSAPDDFSRDATAACVPGTRRSRQARPRRYESHQPGHRPRACAS